MDTPALEIRGLNSGYGKKRIVADLELSVESYRITSLIGRNGVGKTTALKTIMGIINAVSGSIKYMGEEITHSKTHDLVKKGISYVPQGKSIFPHMSVNEHLDIGGVTLLDKEKREKIRSKVIDLFPKLRERKYQKAGTLSGGERQMLSIGRALMSGPKLLLLDEPSFGLAPNIVDNVFESIKQINKEGVTVLVVEQNANKALMNSTYGFVMDMGKIIFEGESEKLMNDKNIRDAYLGGK